MRCVASTFKALAVLFIVLLRNLRTLCAVLALKQGGVLFCFIFFLFLLDFGP